MIHDKKLTQLYEMLTNSEGTVACQLREGIQYMTQMMDKEVAQMDQKLAHNDVLSTLNKEVRDNHASTKKIFLQMD